MTDDPSDMSLLEMIAMLILGSLLWVALFYWNP